MSNLLFFHDKVIDQSGFANVYGNGYKNGTFEFFDRSNGVNDLNVDTRIIGCPIIREADGLAKSSRNTYLNGEERQAALVLNRSLKAGKALVDAGETRACVIKSAITAEIEKEPLAKIDYVDDRAADDPGIHI